MDLVFSNVYIGGQDDCQRGFDNLSVVHAVKHPCHQRILQYKGSLPPSHPNYLYFRQDQDLFLNIIDPDVPLFKLETFKIFLEFAMEQEGVHNRVGGNLRKVRFGGSCSTCQQHGETCNEAYFEERGGHTTETRSQGPTTLTLIPLVKVPQTLPPYLDFPNMTREPRFSYFY